MTSSANKLLAGGLMVGMGMATGGATLAATAAGVGVNWLSEGLADLWAGLAAPPQEALARAYAAAIRDGVQALKERYRRTVDGRADLAPFELVAACAGEVAQAEFPSAAADAEAAGRALAAALASLLHGHDERQAAFLSRELLPACAAAFQARLLADEAAWRAFHGLVLQGLARNSAALMARIEGFARLLSAWGDPIAAIEHLRQATDQVTALARVPAATPIFDNRGLRVGGDVYQAAGNQYFGSAHAQGGGTATVTNIIGAAAGPLPAASPAPAAGVSLLFLAANPVDTPRLRLDQEARRVDAALRQARHGGRFHLTQQWAVRGEDLLDALLRGRPAIVHFAGHGGAQGQLCLEDAAGRAAAVAPGALAGLVGVAGGVRCTVLNACWTDALADALLAISACVVGMTAAVMDAAAIAFAAGFYRALADGENLAAAVAAGRAQAAAESGDEATPAVQLRVAPGVDPAAMRFP